MNNTKLAFLEQTTAPRIIAYLKENEKASLTEIFKNIQGSQSAKYSALKKLNENKITEQSPPQGRYRRIDISLTEKGKKIAEHLIEIEKILGK